MAGTELKAAWRARSPAIEASCQHLYHTGLCSGGQGTKPDESPVATIVFATADMDAVDQWLRLCFWKEV
jgi:hypothetical protein